MWMLRALDMVEEIFPDERNQFFREFGADAIQLARNVGWDEEAAAWQEAFDAYEAQQISLMRKELDACSFDPQDLTPEMKELMGMFDVDMAGLAQSAGLTEEAAAWRAAMEELEDEL